VRRGKDLSPSRRFGAAGPRGGGSTAAGGGVGEGQTVVFTGSPEGVVTADAGQVGIQSDASRIWIKVSGSGNTGWESQSKHTTGTGDPNGAVVGRPGDSFYSTDLQTRYVKGSGVNTNTGWV
jgi:hypothetical protein